MVSKKSLLHTIAAAGLIVKPKFNLMPTLSMLFTVIKWRIQDFPDRGLRPLSLGQKPNILQDFCQKLHENERNWTQREGAS